MPSLPTPLPTPCPHPCPHPCPLSPLQVIVGSVDGNRLWGKELKTRLAFVEWSPDGRSLLFVTLDGEVHVYNQYGNRLGSVGLFAAEESSTAPVSCRFPAPWFGVAQPLGLVLCGHWCCVDKGWCCVHKGWCWCLRQCMSMVGAVGGR